MGASSPARLRRRDIGRRSLLDAGEIGCEVTRDVRVHFRLTSGAPARCEVLAGSTAACIRR